LGQSASQSRLGNALITGGLGIAGATDWGNVLGRQPTTPTTTPSPAFGAMGAGGWNYRPANYPWMNTVPYNPMYPGWT
jgi:hypothetical protein